MHGPSRRQLGVLVSVGTVPVVVGATVAFLAVANRPPAPAAPYPTAAATPSPPDVAIPSPGPTVPVCVDVAHWPLDRRLEQLLIVSGVFDDLSASADEARAGIGALVLFGQPQAGQASSIAHGLEQLRADAAAADQVPPWMSTDEEGGYVQRLAGVVGVLPAPRHMGSEWTPDQVRHEMTVHAAALRALGIDMDLAPVLDVAAPDDAVADEEDRAFSDDPSVVAADGVAYAEGLEAGGVTPVVKHFPGLGRADVNTDVAVATDPSLASLESSDLLPFEAAVSADVPVIMISNVRVPGLTGNVPASLAPATYRLLRDSLGFQGVAMTDALDAGAIAESGYSQPRAVVAAISAGADLAMIDSQEWQPVMSALRQAVLTGRLSTQRVDDAVRSVLSAKGLSVCVRGQ
ncbi:MAG TPA: glycoside hydrolase family 3 N-terminal domain-containing protein [Candidatus Dormibacteraeota bacterium]